LTKDEKIELDDIKILVKELENKIAKQKENTKNDE
jgi:hypothetical protein